jgi:hypothetical protein
MSTNTIERSAEISDCGNYRWWLRRVLNNDNNRVVCFLLLNPSVADAERDDPTCRRCMDFTLAWGCSILSIRNIFPFRTPSPRELKRAGYPTGGRRADLELMAALDSDILVAGWGRHAPKVRVWDVEKIFKGKPVYCLGKNGDGSPVHPLYQPKDLKPQPFWNCTATTPA